MRTPSFQVRLVLCLPRDNAGVRTVRMILDSALGVLEVTDACREEIALALTEACGNVVAHARYADQYEVSVQIADGACRIDVSDSGVGFTPTRPLTRPPPDVESGRGLYLIATMTDQFELDSRPGLGTTVRFAKQLEFTDNVSGSTSEHP